MSKFILILFGLLMFVVSCTTVLAHPYPSLWESPSHDYSVGISDRPDMSALNQPR
jgi:hypothetical protein